MGVLIAAYVFLTQRTTLGRRGKPALRGVQLAATGSLPDTFSHNGAGALIQMPLRT